jgi:hypothetical protein
VLVPRFRSLFHLPPHLRQLTTLGPHSSTLVSFSLRCKTLPHFLTAPCSTHRHCESRNPSFGADPRPVCRCSSYLTEADLPNLTHVDIPPPKTMTPPRFLSLHGMIATQGLCKEVARLWPPSRSLLSFQSACPGLPGRLPESGYKAVPATHTTFKPPRRQQPHP